MTATTADKVLAALAPHGIKEVKRGEYRLNSPLRPGSNSHGFALTIEGDENGAYFDHVSGESGSLYQLAEKLGIPLPERKVATNTKRQYEGLADYARAHGVSEEVFAAVGWKETTHGDRPALSFPTATGERYRFLDGKKPSYINNVGYKATVYGLKRAPSLAREKQTPLVICNGEASTVVAQHFGIPAVCQTGGEKRWEDQNIEALNAAWSGDLILAMDCDETGERVATQIAEQFGKRARIVDLGFTAGGDLADFCMLHTENALSELVKQPAPIRKPEPEPPKLTDGERIAKALDELRTAMRAEDNKQLALEAAVARAQATIDQISMGLATPVLASFSEVSWRAELTAMDARDGIRAAGTLTLDPKVPGKQVYGFPALNEAIGDVPIDLIILLGATGSGKTWTAVSLVRELLPQGPLLIVPTEMTKLKWMQRLAASVAGVNYTDVKHGRSKQEEWKRLGETFDHLGELQADFLDHPSPTPQLIRSAMKTAQADGKEYAAVMVDSGSKMSYPGTADMYSISRGVSNGVQDLSREFNIPVFMTWQTGADIENRAKGSRMPQLKDAYGGLVAVQNAGVVLGLYNHHYYVKRGLEDENLDMPRGTVAIRCLKIRDEDDGDAPVTKITWMGAGYEQRPTQTVSLRGDA